MAEPAVTPVERPKVLTGRAVKERRLRVDEAVHVLDLVAMRSVLAGPMGGAYTSTAGIGPGVRSDASMLLLRDEGDGQPLGFAFVHVLKLVLGDERVVGQCLVRLTATRPFYGGRRWWFRCPVSQGEDACDRRVRVLYMAPGNPLPGCRQCLGLTYASRQRHRGFAWETWEQPLQRIQRLARDLRSRSPRRRLRALVAVDPEFVGQMLGGYVPATLNGSSRRPVGRAAATSEPCPSSRSRGSR